MTVCHVTHNRRFLFFFQSLVCPFFADQFMWGFFVELAKVGPKAVPVNELTTELLTEKLKSLASAELATEAKELASKMALEDGVKGGFEHWSNSLQRDNMLCDVSLILGETRKARFELIGAGLRANGIKVCPEVAALLRAKMDWKSYWGEVLSLKWTTRVLALTRTQIHHQYW
jgi:hypothetical protein